MFCYRGATREQRRPLSRGTDLWLHYTPAMRRLWAYLLVAAMAPHPADALAARAGDLDPTFNGGQMLLVDVIRTIPRVTIFWGIAFDAMGNFLVAGSATDGDGRIAVGLVRVTSGGVVDTSFASNGTQVLQLGGGPTPFSSAFAIGPRPGGGWLVAGGASDDADRPGMLTAAFDANGTMDPAYGSGGRLRPQPAGAPPEETFASGGHVAVDGAVFIAGQVDRKNGVDAPMALAKVTPEGTSASDFGNLGGKGAFVGSFSQSPVGNATMANAVLQTPQGILVTGTTGDPLNRQQLFLLRLTPSGAPDLQFGASGVVRLQAAEPGLDTHGSAIALGPDGKIYVGGNVFVAYPSIESPDAVVYGALSVTRFTAGGLPDGSFGTNATRRFHPAPDTFSTTAGDIAVQPDGRILVLGSSRVNAENDHEVVVLRLETDGDLDPTFGDGGVARFRVGDMFAASAVISSDGRSLVFVGSSRTGSIQSGVIGRVLLADLPTTSTTLPGGCGAVGSVAGARCRVARIADEAASVIPSGKLKQRVLRAVGRAEDRLEAAEKLAGRGLRRSLQRALAGLRGVSRLLVSKAAERALSGEQRAALVADAIVVTSEVQTLIEP
jgi:uncharacterized delta-60 repeat protein